jgi:hypothetical protein
MNKVINLLLKTIDRITDLEEIQKATVVILMESHNKKLEELEGKINRLENSVFYDLEVNIGE